MHDEIQDRFSFKTDGQQRQRLSVFSIVTSYINIIQVT